MRKFPKVLITALQDIIHHRLHHLQEKLLLIQQFFLLQLSNCTAYNKMIFAFHLFKITIIQIEHQQKDELQSAQLQLYITTYFRNIFMQGSKFTLNMRKPLKKQPKERFHIKTQKIVRKQQQLHLQSPTNIDISLIAKHFKAQKKIHQLRQNSVVAKKQLDKIRQVNIRQSSSVDRESKKIDRKFPQIYNPTVSSAKYFDFKKYQGKFAMSSTNSAIQKRKIQSEHISQKPLRTENKLSNPRNIKLRQIQSLKQMSKQKKIQLFKVIRSQFNDLINTTNNLSVRNQDVSFKAYIQKGNNYILVRQIMKKRWWWHIQEDKSKANLIWTEWFDKTVTANLKSFNIYDQTINIDQYSTKKYEQSNNKYEIIKKLVDDKTFDRIEKKISIHSNTYFKLPKGSSGLTQSMKICEEGNEDFKIINVQVDQVIHNHVEGCLNLHSKKLLFMNFHKFMTQYTKQWDPFKFMPLTYYIQSRDSPMIEELLKKFDYFEEQKKSNNELKNIWICKPGENSNRGNGIKVVKQKAEILSQIKSRLPQNNSGNRSVVIQKYIQKCFLIHNRKFDIRCYILLTTVNGILKGYWYKDGYIRTSSAEYNLEDTSNQMIHLTNDAIQKKGEDFGKHEDSNKLNFQYFRQYLKKSGLNFYKFDQSYEQMKLIAYYLIASVSTKIKRKQYTFELFGLDFMLDQQLNPLLIQANSNPCLSNHGKILGKLIHELVQNVFMTAIDPIFPPPKQQQQRKKMNDQINKDYFESNKFQLIFTGKDKGNNEQNKNKASATTSIFEKDLMTDKE